MRTQILKKLKKFGVVQIEGTFVKVKIDDGDNDSRRMMLGRVARLYKTKIREDRPDFSSIGYVLVDGYKISVKPKNCQGFSGPGIANEDFLLRQIHKYLSSSGTLDIVFWKGKKRIVCNNVKSALETDYGPKEHRMKGDLSITTDDGRVHSFSIKQDDAEKWESADEYYGRRAKAIIEVGMKKKSVYLLPVVGMDGKPLYYHGDIKKPIMKIIPEIYRPMSKKDQHNILFGDDITTRRGGILIRTFTRDDFRYDAKKNRLYVRCSQIYRSLRDVRDEDMPYWLIRNDPARNSRRIGISGIRVEAVRKSRISCAEKL